MTVTRFGTALAAIALAPTLAISRPLDGLTGAEMQRVPEILRNAGEANDETRYPLIELIEPPKAEVLAWSEGDPTPRRALVHLRNKTGFRAAVVDIAGGAVEAAGPAGGQPMVLFEEFAGAMSTALEHPEMSAGLARRGLTPDDVFCLPLTAGNYLTPEYEDTRLMKVPCYLNPTGSKIAPATPPSCRRSSTTTGATRWKSRTQSACSNVTSAIRPGAISRYSPRAKPRSCRPKAGTIPNWWCEPPR